MFINNVFPSPKTLRISFICCISVLILGLITLSWNLIYYNHSWHHSIFYTNGHINSNFILAFSIALSCLIIFGTPYIFVRKKTQIKVIKIISYILFGLYNCAALATLVTIIVAIFYLFQDYNNIRLDNQLASENSTELHEAVDSVINRSSQERLSGNTGTFDNKDYMILNPHGYFDYDDHELNEYMLKAARSGYAPAQNYAGEQFHDKAKWKNNNHWGYKQWDNSTSSECHDELSRATYWWLKAAEQNNSAAQENLGKMWMKEILSDKPFSFEEAQYWLTKAANNGKISSYYYLGMLYRDYSIAESAKYFKAGAEKGDENCMIMLEDPDYIDVRITTSSPQPK